MTFQYERVRSPGVYFTIRDIREANAERGHHFFEPATMRFFKSRILRGVIHDKYFITSERGPGMPRLYTIRKALPDGSIDTVGEFQAYETARQARAAARRLS